MASQIERYADMDPCAAANRRALSELRSASSRDVMRKLEEIGIYDSDGQLTPRYGGPTPTPQPPKDVDSR